MALSVFIVPFRPITVQAANNNVGLHLNNLLCEAEATIHELGNFETNQQSHQNQGSGGGSGGGGGGGLGSGSTGKTTFSNIIGKWTRTFEVCFLPVHPFLNCIAHSQIFVLFVDVHRVSLSLMSNDKKKL